MRSLTCSSTGVFWHISLVKTTVITIWFAHKYNIGWKRVNVGLETPFTKNMDSLETSQLFCIAVDLTGFWIISVLSERCFWTDLKLLMFEKVFQTVNVNLWFSFPLWSFTSGTSRREDSPFIYCTPEIYFE